MSPEPFRTPASVTLSLRSTDSALSAPPESDEDGPWTVVVAPKQEEDIDGTVVVGNKKGTESDFVITSNIVVINADVDVIDNGSKK